MKKFIGFAIFAVVIFSIVLNVFLIVINIGLSNRLEHEMRGHEIYKRAYEHLDAKVNPECYPEYYTSSDTLYILEK